MRRHLQTGAAPVIALLSLAAPSAAAPGTNDPRLSATLVGRLEAGAAGRVAVRWDGPEGALLDLWVDLDGDGVPASHELHAEGRTLSPGIEVVSFELPPGVPVAPDPRVWVRARDRGWCDRSATVATADDGDPCGWQPGFAFAGLSRSARAMTVHDDGSGPALYVGGEFTSAGNEIANNIARWDGAEWFALSGPSGTGVGGGTYPTVNAVAAFDDGTGTALYVGGSFTSAGGVVVSNIARWDGSAWSALDGGGVTANRIARWDGSAWSALSGPSDAGVDGSVEALAVFDDGFGPALYVGGSFETAGGVTVNNIARWDGSEWHALSGPSGTGVAGTYPSVSAFAVFDDGSGPGLYVGGSFETAGGLTVDSVARWDGIAWSALDGGGVAGSVWALAVYDDGSGPALYVGGSFETAGGVTVNNIARWNGTGWSELSGPSGTGIPVDDIGGVNVLSVHNHGSGSALYAGGLFTTAGGVTVNSIARWNGSEWSALSGPFGTGVGGWVMALAVFDDGSGPAHYAGGSFHTAGGVTVSNTARWDDNGWSALGAAAGIDGVVGALAVFDDGSGPALYAGGDFTSAGDVTVSNIARWDGSAWSALDGDGVAGSVWALAVYDDGSGPALYVGGDFATAGGLTVNHIARWDGSEWSALSGPSATGLDGWSVYALAVFDDGSGSALYAGGLFTTAGGLTVNSIARWNGTEWSALSGPSGTGVGGLVMALEVFDDASGPALYAGGGFTTAGEVTVNNIARWNGTEWSALNGPTGTGTSGEVRALAAFDDAVGPSLYAGGSFTSAGGVTVNHIARWDGSEWSALSGPSATGVDGWLVYALAAFDDGSGPALYAGGLFATAGGVTVHHIARWDGSEWSDLSGPSATGVDGGISYTMVVALAVFDDGIGPTLYAGGDFTSAGGVPSLHIAAWRCSSEIFVDGFEGGSTAAWSHAVP